ncbi:hypothetical protein BESB_006300 [Besnoitia besnoiti]|uniref:Uncharacterized protein n=1 Tax=Besnoitia besnoiti TaxID=94643 RepID=A0A2A9MK36_BESBE|nr:hypothetical protein BESB_006300 [Besnoitia besnoiti]PFH38289.1 hypothetical protein BESB_006300 [Besnoitia besnoiti]
MSLCAGAALILACLPSAMKANDPALQKPPTDGSRYCARSARYTAQYLQAATIRKHVALSASQLRRCRSQKGTAPASSSCSNTGSHFGGAVNLSHSLRSGLGRPMAKPAQQNVRVSQQRQAQSLPYNGEPSAAATFRYKAKAKETGEQLDEAKRASAKLTEELAAAESRLDELRESTVSKAEYNEVKGLLLEAREEVKTRDAEIDSLKKQLHAEQQEKVKLRDALTAKPSRSEQANRAGKRDAAGNHEEVDPAAQRQESTAFTDVVCELEKLRSSAKAKGAFSARRSTALVGGYCHSTTEAEQASAACDASATIGAVFQNRSQPVCLPADCVRRRPTRTSAARRSFAAPRASRCAAADDGKSAAPTRVLHAADGRAAAAPSPN